jgi:hypothetical protein
MRKVHPNHRKVTPEQRHQLIQIYLHMGFCVASQLCVEWGVSALYAAREAKERGIDIKRPRKSMGKSDSAVGVDHLDPRWAWAVERGSVVA